MENHVCLSCLGRIVSRMHPKKPAVRVFRCSNCGHVGEASVGARRPPICACTARYGPRDAGLRCVVNPARDYRSPNEIIVVEEG